MYKDLLFPRDFIPDSEKLSLAVSDFILSASGWRKVFAADNSEQSLCQDVDLYNRLLAALTVSVFSDFINNRDKKVKHEVLIATDTRPTGSLLADLSIRVLLSNGIVPRYAGVCAAPEIMSWAREEPTASGFLYISASHNPPGHNGFKFGNTSGGVLSSEQIQPLIADFKKLITSKNSAESLLNNCNSIKPDCIKQVYSRREENKARAKKIYHRFIHEIASGSENKDEQRDFIKKLQKSVKAGKATFAAELNGSARTTSGDAELLESIGVKVISLNDKPGIFRHEIIPEGDSLKECCQALNEAATGNPGLLLGYVPDCDGDRGNIAWFDRNEGKAKPLEAQSLFALAVLSELSWQRFTGNNKAELAVVVNGPTSMRIEAIAKAFNAKVFRCEVGEANVVKRAVLARQEGYDVRILGEGSNGGSIVHPAAVRDPLNTLISVLKLMCVPGVIKLWRTKCGLPNPGSTNPDFEELLRSLPAFITTGAAEKRAVMSIKTRDHAVFKSAWEAGFPAQWKKMREHLYKRLGVCSWREVNYEGTEARTGVGASYRSGAQTGGLKIEFLDKHKEPLAFTWMRGSGTEPVFRILADVAGEDKSMETQLLEWQREMVTSADRKAQNTRL